MATYLINAVRYTKERSAIAQVRLTTAAVHDRAWVVTEIKAGRTFKTAPPNGPGADVHVVAGKFISTDPNESKRDNLGNLPEF